ncbi:MAG: hypothetical protein JNN06_09225 [Gemmobacter sp.]|uniref:glyoxalase superfamily protein n=1 Tax=Gemmobacter sp. TaxID=1898957 RepID=UPI001A53252C|nr:glyoxalase superfamily protein [Gemmobacter sp.]MBL8562449.1 hypothetical protein [Gemmobacter sp.]
MTTGLNETKTQAKRLAAVLSQGGAKVPLSRAYEILAQSAGFADWNTLSAHLSQQPAPGWRLGDRVRGRYIGQVFEGRVHGLRRKGSLTEIEIQADHPVNVSRSALFEAPRRRLRATIGADGRSVTATSDGVPHLIVE